jgi:hypothetical protein
VCVCVCVCVCSCVCVCVCVCVCKETRLKRHQTQNVSEQMKRFSPKTSQGKAGWEVCSEVQVLYNRHLCHKQGRKGLKATGIGTRCSVPSRDRPHARNPEGHSCTRRDPRSCIRFTRPPKSPVGKGRRCDRPVGGSEQRCPQRKCGPQSSQRTPCQTVISRLRKDQPCCWECKHSLRMEVYAME